MCNNQSDYFLKFNQSAQYDPGKDGDFVNAGTGPNAEFAGDVFGFNLSYYDGDYQAISSAANANTFYGDINGSDVEANCNNLYNGNIRSMQTTIQDFCTRAPKPMANAYQYDQLNRLNESRSFVNYDAGTNTWGNAGTYDNKYYNAFVFDAMGNIHEQKRYTGNGLKIEDLYYRYEKDGLGRLKRNRLYHIDDTVAAGVDATDLDDMGTLITSNINASNNYSYDEEGRLIKDEQEEIENIEWRVDGKVKSIIRTSTSTKKNLVFDYDAMGHRIAKHIVNNNTSLLEHSTYYMLDASGNTMSTYEHEVDQSNASYYLAERHIFGSSRLGILQDSVNMDTIFVDDQYHYLGRKVYELSNHLGNVLTVIDDILLPSDTDSDTYVDTWQVGLIRVTDYSPFGVQLDGRTMDMSTCDPNDTTYTTEEEIEYISDFIVDESIIPEFDGWFGNITTTAINLVPVTGGNRLRAISTNSAHGMNHYFDVASGIPHRINFNLDKAAMSNVGFSVYNVDVLGNEVLLFNSTMSTTALHTFTITPTQAKILVKLHGNGTFYMDNFVIEEAPETSFHSADFETYTAVYGSIDSWQMYFGSTNIWVNSGELNVTSTTSSHGVSRRYAVPTGVSHTVNFDLNLNGMANIAIVVHRVTSGGVRSGTYIGVGITSSGAQSYNFTTTAGFPYIDIEIRKSSANGTYKLDNIVVKQTTGSTYSTSNFTAPTFQPPSIDGWTIDMQTTKLNLITYSSSKRLISDGPVFQEFNIDNTASYKIDFNYLKGTVTNGKFEVYKIVGVTPTLILSQTISTNGNYSHTVTPGENKMKVVFSGTTAGNFYVDNIVIKEILYTPVYDTDFESTTVVQPGLDGWMCDLTNAYLTADAPVSVEERMIVTGTNTSGAFRYFAVNSGNIYTLDFPIAIGISVYRCCEYNGSRHISTKFRRVFDLFWFRFFLR